MGTRIETDLIGQGCIAASYLDAMKARVLLSLLLGDGADQKPDPPGILALLTDAGSLAGRV